MSDKLLISGILLVKTGLHIGGSSDFAAIGAVDSPIVRDSLTKLPMIPGSSLKGKLRYLLAKSLSDDTLMNEPNEDPEEVLRLFGSSEKDNIQRAHLKFNDLVLSNNDELEKKNVSATEIKFENNINRETAVATPRQIERVIAGSEFNFDIFYDLDDESKVTNDFENIKKGFRLLEYDYLGGNGTRGSGRVAFNNLSVKSVIGNFDVSRLNQILEA